jgi:hypothetical protein
VPSPNENQTKTMTTKAKILKYVYSVFIKVIAPK